VSYLNVGFGKYIRQLRKDRGLDIKSLANLMGKSESLVSRYENERREMRREDVILLAELLNVDSKELLVRWMSDQIIRTYGDEALVLEAMQLAQDHLTASVYRSDNKREEDFSELLAEADRLKGEWLSCREFAHEKVMQALETEYTFESNRIEGNTLSLHETEMIVRHGLTIQGKRMQEHLEAINHQEAIGFIQELSSENNPPSISIIRQIHQLVLRGIDARNAGVFRNVPVMISGSSHVPSQPYLLQTEMEAFERWLKQNYLKLHPLVYAAEAHYRLVHIHPFIDGNGRTSRLLMNLILMQHEYIIANIRGDDNNRLAYYKALETSHQSGNKASFIRFVIENEILSLKRLLQLIKG
jgi:Fic family protein